MKITFSKIALYTFSAALLVTACQKSESGSTGTSTNGSQVTTNNYGISLSAAAKGYDSVSVDVDNDKVKDFTILAYNSAYGGYKYAMTIQACYIFSMQDSALVAITNRYANDGWSRIYNYGSGSYFFTYAGGFVAGDVIGSGVPDYKTAARYAAISTAFEPIGKTVDCTSEYFYEGPPNGYNELVGDFLNKTEYIGFTIHKADGRHYGWIKLSNSNSCLNIQVISSGYSTVAGQPITTN